MWSYVPFNLLQMYSKQLFYLLALTVMSLAVEERKVHRLVGGHLRIINPDSDDSELMTASASGSKEDKKKKPEDEERKTLSQQVADGKYGLIQKELFKKPPKRPGVLSYADNPEVPNDNISNLGGLTKNDIWLAENHLLVLRGGTYPPHDDKNDYSPAQLWPAIDDYKAPNRQVINYIFKCNFTIKTTKILGEVACTSEGAAALSRPAR